MRWIAAPLVALTLFTGAGFVGALARTTKLSAVLTASTEEAPRSTTEAAEQTSSLPIAAELTGRQADAFEELVGALSRTAEQVRRANRALAAQSRGLVTLRRATAGLGGPVACSRKRLLALVGASDDAPAELRRAIAIIGSLIAVQDGSIRHLRSINRKLAPLEVLATATDARALDPPSSPPEVAAVQVRGKASVPSC